MILHFSGMVGGLSKEMVDLANVDNTSDLAKPISNATQDALDLKASFHNPIFSGTVGGLSKGMVALSNVDNTSDLTKPISTATQNAPALKAPLNTPTFTGTISVNETLVSSISTTSLATQIHPC